MTRMQAKYVVVRYIPNTLRGEFVNVGVVLVCPEVGFQDSRMLSSIAKVKRINNMNGFDGNFVRHAVTKLRDAVSDKQMQIFLGNSAPEGRLNLENIELLPRIYSNNIRVSEVFTCITQNPMLTLEKLFSDFVGVEAPAPISNHINRRRILHDVTSTFREQGLFGTDGLKEELELPVRTNPVVDLAYKNHVLHCYQAIPFQGNETRVLQSVNAYRTVKRDAHETSDAPQEVREAKFAILTIPPNNSNSRIADIQALLEEEKIDVLDYRDAPLIAQDIARDLQRNQAVVN